MNSYVSPKSINQSTLSASHSKPKCSFASLITMAIQKSEAKMVTTLQIFHFVIENFPYYQQYQVRTRRYIPSILWKNECFVKVSPSNAPNLNATYWTLRSLLDEDDCYSRPSKRVKYETACEFDSNKSSDTSMSYTSSPTSPSESESTFANISLADHSSMQSSSLNESLNQVNKLPGISEIFENFKQSLLLNERIEQSLHIINCLQHQEQYELLFQDTNQNWLA